MTKNNDKDIIYGDSYRGYKINNGNNSEYSCYKDSLDKIINDIEDKTNRHNKVHITRIDVNTPQVMSEKEQSKAMTRVVESTRREISRKHKHSSHDPDISIIRTTEIGYKENNVHFHFAITSNGNAIQNAYTFLETMTRHCERILDTPMAGRVNNSSANNGLGIMINRNSPDFEQQMQDAVYVMSYLAKTNTKENLRKGTHKLSISRSKKK